MPDQNEIGQVLFTAKKKKKPWKNGFYKMGDLCLGLARVSGPDLSYFDTFLTSWSSPIIVFPIFIIFMAIIIRFNIIIEGAWSPTDVLPAEVP